MWALTGMRDSQSDLLRGKNAERKAMVRGSPVEGGGLLLGLLERVRGLEAQQLRDLAAVRVVLEAPVPAGRRKRED